MVGVPFGTDAAAISAAGVPTVVFGPGSIDQAHTADEFIAIDELRLATEIFYRISVEGVSMRSSRSPLAATNGSQEVVTSKRFASDAAKLSGSRLSTLQKNKTATPAVSRRRGSLSLILECTARRRVSPQTMTHSSRFANRPAGG